MAFVELGYISTLCKATIVFYELYYYLLKRKRKHLLAEIAPFSLFVGYRNAKRDKHLIPIGGPPSNFGNGSDTIKCKWDVLGLWRKLRVAINRRADVSYAEFSSGSFIFKVLKQKAWKLLMHMKRVNYLSLVRKTGGGARIG